MKTVTNMSGEKVDQQIQLIKKGALEIIGEEELRIKLARSINENRPLIVKLGLDPTAPDLHLGHTVVLRKIRQLQSLGHKAFLIIGDFTGRIGDPTGKQKGRPQLTEKEVLENADTYAKQLFKVLDPNQTIICFNSEWLDTMKPSELLTYMSKHTVARILERDSFKQRLKSGDPIGLHEMMYPILQAIDSVTIKADIEIGGSDQTFNILMGREMQGREDMEKQVAIFMPIIEGLDGIEKMSKSLGNAIGIDESAISMYEKIMTIKDDLIIKYFELLTDLEPEIISNYKDQLVSNRTNPKNLKMRLAREITALYHSEADTLKAEERFIRVFSKKLVPRVMPMCEWIVDDNLSSFLTRHNIVKSKSEVRRLVSQKGVRINDTLILEPEVIGLMAGDVVRIGKKKFVQLK
jgi:tyrosyl-tRNA synthetase